MISSFWKKGFYINNAYFFYKKKSITALKTIFGLNYHYLQLILLRVDTNLNIEKISLTNYDYRENKFYLKTNTLLTNNRIRINFKKLLINFSDKWHFLFFHYLLMTFPVFLNLKKQYDLNLNFFFINKTFKGISFKIGRFLFRRTRAKTYNHFKKSIKLQKI